VFYTSQEIGWEDRYDVLSATLCTQCCCYTDIFLMV